MLMAAAAEQCALRSGTELTLPDIARAVAIVAPDLSPVRVEVETIGTDVVAVSHERRSAEAARFIDGLLAPDRSADDALLPAAVAALDPNLFSFEKVQTTWSWRTGSIVQMTEWHTQGGGRWEHSSRSPGDKS
jgi:hypothetical protein